MTDLNQFDRSPISVEQFYKVAKYFVVKPYIEPIAGDYYLPRQELRNIRLTDLQNVKSAYLDIGGSQIITITPINGCLNFELFTGTNLLMGNYITFHDRIIRFEKEIKSVPIHGTIHYEAVVAIFDNQYCIPRINRLYYDMGQFCWKLAPQHGICQWYLHLAEGFAGLALEPPLTDGGITQSNASVCHDTGRVICYLYATFDILNLLSQDPILKTLADVSSMLGQSSHGPLTIITENPTKCQDYLDQNSQYQNVKVEIYRQEVRVDHEATLALNQKYDLETAQSIERLKQEIKNNQTLPIELSPEQCLHDEDFQTCLHQDVKYANNLELSNRTQWRVVNN